MSVLFVIASLAAVGSTAMAITRRNAVHALLYLVVSFLAAAFVLFLLGAPFIAALEVIIYAGAIMVLFVFVVMMFSFNATRPASSPRRMLKTWAGPVFLSLVLFVEFLVVILSRGVHPLNPTVVAPRDVGLSMFGTYLLGVELAAMLLLAGIVAAFHIGRRTKEPSHRFFKEGRP